MLVVARADGRPGRSDPATMFTAGRVQAPGRWTDHDVLRVAPTGVAWSAWVSFTSEGEHVGWYVNPEDPHRRDADTVCTRDHVLDLWVEPDRARERKDEDELVLAVEQGRCRPVRAREIERTAVEVEALIDAWGPPFCDGWETFRPDPAWGPPALPPPAPAPAAR